MEEKTLQEKVFALELENAELKRKLETRQVDAPYIQASITMHQKQNFRVSEGVASRFGVRCLDGNGGIVSETYYAESKEPFRIYIESDGEVQSSIMVLIDAKSITS